MQTHCEFDVNKKEIALLQKIASGGVVEDHEIDSVMSQIAELRNTDLQHSLEHERAPSDESCTTVEAAATTVVVGSDLGNESEGEDHNPYNPFAEHMPGAPEDAEGVRIDPSALDPSALECAGNSIGIAVCCCFLLPG